MIGVDFSEGMLARARIRTAEDSVELVRSDLHGRLPFPSGAFDLVVSGLVLEHVRDLDHFFGEVQRTLTGGGLAVISAMHPAMFRRGSQARFTDPASGEVVHVGSHDHPEREILRALRAAGLRIEAREEHAPDAAFAGRFPRAEKYVGWPMLLLLALRRPLEGI